jgi:FtsH-binding integral membrane protein
MAIKTALAMLVGVLLTPLFTYAAARNFSELVDSLVGLINTGVGFLLIFGIIVYFWGISVNILKFENDPEKRKAYFFWGIIVLFVMFSIWGIIELLQNTLFDGGSYGIGGGGAITGPQPGTSPDPFSGFRP